MKKLIIVIAISLMAAATTQAQFYKGIGIKAGTTIATNATSYNGHSFYHEKDRYDFTAGIFKESSIFKNFNAQIAINYARKGKLVEIIQTNEFGVLTENTSYIHQKFDLITAELYGKYIFHNTNLRPYLLAGLRSDFYISQYSFFREYNANGTELTIEYPKSKSIIFGASIGAGVEYPASKIFSVFIESTYNPNFSDITNETKYGELKIRGDSFDIRTGIKF